MFVFSAKEPSQVLLLCLGEPTKKAITRMYGMLKGKVKPAGDQGPRLTLPHEIITRARGGRERRRLRAGKIKTKKAVTF